MIKSDILINMSKRTFIGIQVYIRAFVPVTASHAPACSGKDPPIMVICRNCRSSLPDGTQFCHICNYQLGELPTTPFSHGNISSSSPAYTGTPDMGNEEDTAQVAAIVRKSHNASLAELSSNPTHVDQHQTPPTHEDHQQAQAIYDPHHQAKSIHTAHYQLQRIHAAHRQSVADHAKHLKKVRKGCRPSGLAIAISSLIVVSLIAITLLLIYFLVY